MPSAADLHDQLDDSLEDLADGLDVLKILEKAYEKTMQAHVVVPDAKASAMDDGSVFAPSVSPEQAGSTSVEHEACSATGETSVAGEPGVSQSTRSSDAQTVGGQRTDPSSPGRASASDNGTECLRSNADSQSHDSAFGSSSRSQPISSTSAAPLASPPPSLSNNASAPTMANLPRAPIPLMEGSSTALLAVLEHTSLPSSSPSPPLTLAHSRPRSPSPFAASDDAFCLGNLLPRIPTPGQGRGRSTGLMLLNPQARRLLERGTPAYPVPSAAVVQACRGRQGPEAKEDDVAAKEERQPASGGAVLRIAHLGDCMAMLVRGEEIVWRTDEMWWNVSAPNLTSVYTRC